MRTLNTWMGFRFRGGPTDDGLALHHLLGEVFGPAVLQPFRLMVAARALNGTVYAYSYLDADELRCRASTSLTPGHADVIALDRLRSLPRPAASWRNGQRLGFDVRLRPVVRVSSSLAGRTADGQEVSFRKGAEVDAFLAAALRDQSVTREGAYLDWLAARLTPAAQLDFDASRLARFQRIRVQRNGRRVEGPDAVVHGNLTISDASAFAELLARGVGRHRAYGYGMLLLRPAQRAR
jgi:CRISPR system Cascade subunit CasE